MNLKSSKYNLIFDYKGKKLAFNSRSASLAEVDENFINMINNIDKIEEKDLNEADVKLIEDMKRGCYIIDKDEDEIQQLKLNNLIGKFGNKGTFGLTIAPTLQCNFACPYCYEERQNGMMSKEVQDAIIKRVEKEAEAKNNISITWYGGEPLLACNIIERMSKKMIEIAKKAGVKYSASIITNGYLINDKVAKMLKNAKVSHAQITLDGPPDVHDSRRKLRGGGATFDRIIENIKIMLKEEIAIGIRINIDKTNVDRLEELLKILADNGLQKCGISLGHVRSDTQACANVAGSCLTIEEYAKKYSKYQEVVLKYKFLEGVVYDYPDSRTNYCCADALSANVVGPDGALYKCWCDIGNQSRKVGDITKEKQKFNKIYTDYLMWSPFENEKCKNCSVLPLCMGGCPYHGLMGSEPECEKWIYNLKDALKFRFDHPVCQGRKCGC